VAGVVSGVATPLAGRLAESAGIVDRPGDLKVHSEEVPYLGGLGVAAGIAAAALTTRGFPVRALWPVAAALALGVADDATGLRPGTRLVAEIAIGSLAAVLTPTGLPAPLGGIGVAAATVGLINAVNLVDGLDGLAGGLIAVSSVTLAGMLDGPSRLAAAGLAGGSVGFLAHNRPPASIYLGDGGAYCAGAMLAGLVGAAWGRDEPAGKGLAALMTVAVPAVEVAAALIRRRRAGTALSVGDRRHTYDLLSAHGWGPRRAAAACVGAQGLLGIGALRLRGARPWKAAVGLATGLGALCAAAGAVGAIRPDSSSGGDHE
jgi:UDP-GlcNAc:undecaprenyl-phosphate GlcNAc-1-phosphate transferase